MKDDGKHRYQRGIIIHRLLQSLPELPPDRRRAAAEAFVKRPAWGLAPDAGAAIVNETLAVLDEPAFAPLFANGSRAEVSVTGLVGKHAISGQVDRLAVTDTEVWIIDYKTNRPPPRDPATVDPAYVFQMATYRAALGAIYPRHNVRCVLLWTHADDAGGPFTMELEPARMDGVLHAAGLI
jgi:ATP-dependent helicase/nuclease subunit A